MARKVFRDRAADVQPHRTLDLQPSMHSGVFASEQIGLKRYRTPEGYLFCEDVPIARTDEMIYGPGEVPVAHGADGLIHISRDAKTLFDMNTLLSYQGKPITNDHPSDDVGPGNWKEHSVGVVLNPRRGEGQHADLMLADFLVTDARAIADIEAGKVEVSCGYDAMYEQTAPGRGVQTNIVGNHVALVDRGRCGQRCAIGDRQLQEEEEMRTRDNQSAAPANETTAAARIRRQFNDAAEAAIKELPKDEGVNVHVHLGNAPAKDGEQKAATPMEQMVVTMDSLIKSVASLTSKVSKMAQDKKVVLRDADKGEGDDREDDDVATQDGEDGEDGEDEEDKPPKKKDDDTTKDSKALATSYQSTLAGAEVLVPGMKVPTFDAAKPRTSTMDSMCKVRSIALDRFAATQAGATVLASLTAGKGYDSLTADCKATAALFKSAVAVQTTNVNAGMTNGSRQAQRGTNDGAAYVPTYTAPSVADIAARHAEHWKKQGVRT